MKRFYKLVTSQKQPGGGYAVLLDGKPVKTPARQALLAPTEDMATEIVREWAGQGEVIVAESMPLTQILSTKIDRVGQERNAMTDYVMKYLDTDLLCYRTEQPPELAARQAAAWDPWLAWFERRFGTMLETTTKLYALTQPEDVKARVLVHIKAMDDYKFTVLQLVTAMGGSLVMALAFVEGAVTAAELFGAARVEEQFKAEIYDENKYGPDPAQYKKDEAVKHDLKAAGKFLTLL